MTTMMCSSACYLGFALASLGPVADPTMPPSPEEDFMASVSESFDLSTRAEQMYKRADEYANKGQYHDAAGYIINAYVELEDEDRFGATGLELLRDGAEYHLRAYRQTKDDTLLTNIQPLLERFLEHPRETSPRIEGLRRDLYTIRELRLSASARYFDNGQFSKAASEARHCYRALQAADQGRAIGEEAALAASRAYREAWHVDGDVRHIEAAIEVVDDHLAKAGELASVPVKRERSELEGDLRRARMSRASRHQDGTLSPRNRTFLLAIGSGLGGGIALSAGAAAVGTQAFVEDAGSSPRIRPHAGLMPTAIGLSLAGGAVAGLASHALADARFISSRRRKLLAASAMTVALAGSVLGSTLLVIGKSGPDDRTLSSAGFSVLVGMSAPLGVGIATIVSRWNER